MTRLYRTGKSGPQRTEVNPDGLEEVVVFDNMQGQDDGDDGGEESDLQGAKEFVLDDCPFGAGVMNVIKSMRLGEVCEAWLGPQHIPGEISDQQQRHTMRAWRRHMLSDSRSCLIVDAGHGEEVLLAVAASQLPDHTRRGFNVYIAEKQNNPSFRRHLILLH